MTRIEVYTTPAATGVEQLTDNTYRVDYGTDVTVKAMPAKHYHLEGWSCTPGTVIPGPDSTATLDSMIADQTVSATFAKNAPELAWMYGQEAMPAEGVSAYDGFLVDTIMKIGMNCNDEFRAAVQHDHATVHYGSVNGVVTFANPLSLMSAQINGIGRDTIYAVHDGSVMAYDSVWFPVNIMAPDTLTLVHNDGGKMKVELGGEGTLLTTINSNENTDFYSGSRTFDNIATVTFSGAVANSGDWGWYHTNGTTLTVTPADGITITRVKFTCSEGSAFDSIAPFEAVLGDGDPWNNALMFVNGTSYGEFGVTKIEVYGYAGGAAGSDSVRAIVTDTTYAVVPGANVTVKAMPDTVHYLVNWDNDAAINYNFDTTKHYVVNGNMTSTANFHAKPTITLWATEGGALDFDREVQYPYLGTSQNTGPLFLTEEDNVYVVNYGASVTVKATPSDTTYLVRFDTDADTNSNVAVEKLYENITEDTTFRAYFNDKPVLTLAQNESQWGTVTIPTVLVATDPTPAPTPTVVANPVITCVLMPDGSMQVTMSCTTQDADIYYTTDNVTSPTCDCPAAPEYTEPITFTEPVTIKAAAYTGNDWSAVVTKTITLSLPAGVAQLTDTTYRVDYGTEVTVQAEATELHHIANWVNEDSVAYPADSITYSDYFVTTPENLFPAHSTLRLKVTADTTTEALFGINSYDVAVTIAETEDLRGTVTISYTDINDVAHTVYAPDTVTVRGDTVATLVATAEYGYHFVHWTDTTGIVLDTLDTLRVTAAANVVAYFDTNAYEVRTLLTDASDGRESTFSGPDTVKHFTSGTVTAHAAYGYHLVNWTNAADSVLGTDTNLVVTPISDTTLYATFTKNVYYISVMVDTAQSYSRTTHTALYLENVSLPVIPKYGYHFVMWSDSVTANPRSITVTGNAVYHGLLAPNKYTVSATADSNRGTFAGTGSVDYLYNDTLRAIGNHGYRFDHWNDGSTENPRIVTVTKDTAFTAYFVIDQFTVTVKSADTTMGTVSGTATVDYGTQVTISATAKEHYHFVKWNDGNTNATRTVTANDDVTYTAIFGIDGHKLTLASNNTIMGNIALVTPTGLTPNVDGSYTIAYGTTVTVKATATNRCFELGSWSNGAAVLANGRLSFTMDGDLALTAIFANHLFTSDTSADVCDRFVWNGITYTETPEVAPMRSYVTTDGCDSALMLNLTVRHSSTNDINVAACNSYSWYEYTDMTESQNVTHIFEGANTEGCDSIVTLHLTIGNIATTDLYVDTCNEYTWKGVTYTETPAVAPSYTYHTSADCDSIVTLHLTIGHPVAIDTTVVACEEYEWYDTTYTVTPAVDPVYTYTSAEGCVNTVTLHLTILHNTTGVDEQTACDSYTWIDGETYTESTGILGAPTYVYHLASGCDSIVTLHLTIKHGVESSFEDTACNSYVWGDSYYTASGDYSKTFEAANGCDSTVTLHLTINQPVATSFDTTVCGDFTWNGIYYSQSGTYTQTFEAANGCDSVVTMNLTVNHRAVSFEFASACDSYEWYGDTYTQSSTYIHIIEGAAANGCDSMITLMLTINSSSSLSETVTICDSYQWHGTTYTASGVYTFDTVTVAGCDSSETLNLTVNQSKTSTLVDEACNYYIWDGTYYNQSGSYSKTYATVEGCDSTVTLTLTINQPTTSSETYESCSDYVWHGQTCTTSGIYTYTTVNAAGCDSVVTLLFTRLQPVYTTVNQTACETFLWNGQWLETSGQYVDTAVSTAGCDSIVTLNLTINHSTSSVVTVTACESYTWHGETYTESTGLLDAPTYTTTNAAGCDSTVTLHLTINQPVSTTVVAAACSSYEWNGTTYTTSGIYTYTTEAANGCDSTVTLLLTINQPVYTNLVVTADGSYEWNGTVYTESGVYIYTTEASNGCDSVVTLNLTVNPYYTVTLTVNNPHYGSVSAGGDVVANDYFTAVATPYDGYEFVAWKNGDEVVSTFNVYTFQVTGDVTLTAVFQETVGIEDVDMDNVTIYSTNSTIYVNGAEGHDVYVYDVNGRIMDRQLNAADAIEFRLTATGVYLVKVGDAPAKRVVVVR